MKVWLVWTGEYSDASVQAVCSSEELANKRGMELRASFVEGFDVDDVAPKPETRVWWQAALRRYVGFRGEHLQVTLLNEPAEKRSSRPLGRLSSYEERDTLSDVRVFVSPERRPSWAGAGFVNHEGQGWEMFTNVEAPTEDVATKIATERFQREFVWWANMGKPLNRCAISDSEAMDLGAIFRDLATEGAPPLAAVFRLRGDGYFVVGRNGHRRIVGTHESVDGIDVEHEALRLEELAAKLREAAKTVSTSGLVVRLASITCPKHGQTEGWLDPRDAGGQTLGHIMCSACVPPPTPK